MANTLKGTRKKVKKKVSKKALGKIDKAQEGKKRLIIKKLLLFTILLIASLLLYTVSTQDLYMNLFLILSILFGFIAIAFLIAYLVFFFRKVMK